MGEKMIGGIEPLTATGFDGATEMQRVPVDDDGGEQVEPRDPVMLTLGGAVADLSLPPVPTALFSAWCASPLSRPICARRCMQLSRIHSMMNSVRSIRPTSRSAAARSFWRGWAASLRRMRLGATWPALMVAAQRNMSGQLESNPPVRAAGRSSRRA